MKMAFSAVANVVLAAILLTSLFFIGVTAGPDEYDPWMDTNDDGRIDMRDIGNLARMYGASGTPINKTALLLELEARIEALNATVMTLEELLGQGLVGEFYVGNETTEVYIEVCLVNWGPAWPGFPGSTHPKKISMWVNLGEMNDGDEIRIQVRYDSDANGVYEYVQDTATRNFTWYFSNSQPAPGILIVDELPVTGLLYVDVYQSSGTPFKVYFQLIVEEL